MEKCSNIRQVIDEDINSGSLVFFVILYYLAGLSCMKLKVVPFVFVD